MMTRAERILESASMAMFVIAVCGVGLGFAGMFFGNNTVWKIGILLASPLYLIVLVFIAAFITLPTSYNEAGSWGGLLLDWFTFLGTKTFAVLLAYGWWQAGGESPETLNLTEQNGGFLFHFSNIMTRVGATAGLFFIGGLSPPRFTHRLVDRWDRVTSRITFWAVLLAGLGMYVQVVNEMPW